MKRSLIVGGSIVAIVILVLAMFPSVVEAKVVSSDVLTNTNQKNISNVNDIKNILKLKNLGTEDFIGDLLLIISQLIFGLLWFLFKYIIWPIVDR
ncbi:MAG: hypothetical protein NT038_02175 [Euryarchaeota archaeon]|nr:hypothetical protein [Euryarchaeota archaeon]